MSLLLPVLFCVTLLARVTHAQGGDGFTDENRPYKFGFNIEGYQHRYEEKNEKGIIMGEYGFITGDGIYHLTVYATDENGNFKIVRTKNVYIGLPGEKMSTPVPAVSSLRPERVQEVTEKAPSAPLLGVAGCGGCVIPTTTAPQAEVTGGPSPVRGNAQVGSPLRPIAGSSRDPGNADRRNPQGLNPGGVTTSIPGRPNPNQIVQGPSQLGGGRPQPGNPSILDGGRTKDPNQNISPISGNVAEGGLNDITNDLNDPKIKQMLGGGRPQPGNPSILDGGRTKDPNRNISPISGNIAQGGLNEITNDLNDPKIQQMVAKVPKMTDKITTMDDLQALFYMFNYTLTYHGHNEVGNRGGDKNGSYFFNGRDGFGRNVSYIANEFGYQPNITLYDLSPEETPKEETEKNLTKLLGNEFKWFYGKG